MSSESSKSKIFVPLILLILIVTGIIAALVLTNDDEEDNDTDSEETTQEESEVGNIVEVAQNTSSLSTLVAAVQAADLVSVLSDEDASFTVFAPTNQAFSNIQSTVDSLLLPENQSQLQNVLQYHVVDSEVFSNQLRDGQVVETLNGDTLKVRIIDGEVYINNSKVVQADVETSNGVVHVIDEVLVPGSFKNVVGTAIDTSDLSTLVAAVQAGELVEALSDPEANYTVFAPTNQAFVNIQSTVDSLLLPENKSQLQNVLQYHVINSEAFSSELTNGMILTTLNGDTLTVVIENGEVFIEANNSRARVVIADVKTSNGVVHVIDEVLVP